MGELMENVSEIRFRELDDRVGRLEDAREGIEVEARASRQRLDDAKNIKFPMIAERLEKLDDRLDDLDAVTLPRIDNNMKDLDKRISTIERTAGRDMSGRMGRAESRQSEFERRIRDLENHVRGYDDV